MPAEPRLPAGAAPPPAPPLPHAPPPPPAPAARFVGSEVYRGSSYGRHHPLRVPRVSTVIDLCRVMGWFGPGEYLVSPRARPAALALWHDPAYLAALERVAATQQALPEDAARFGLGTASNPVFPEMFRRPATSAGGAMLAAELVAAAPGAVHVPGGGTHHGLRDRANGFCYLNDPVLCLLTLRRRGLRRIAYVDIDAHHPDGVESAFADDPDCLMISVHEEGRWPFTGRLEAAGAGNLFNLPVPRGLNDSEMRAILHGLILPRLERFAAEAVVLQCGADAVEEDPLSRLSLSNNALWEVTGALRALAPRLIVLGGGGYDAWAVARAWTGVWAVLSGRPVPEALPAPAQAVLAALPAGLRGRRGPPPPRLLATLRDPPREGPVREEIRDRIRRLAAR